MLAQPVGRLAGWLLFAAVSFGVAAWGFYWTARSNTDLPPLVEFVQDARDVYLPAVQGEGFNPRAFRDAWKLTWLRVGGQWDARVLAIAGAVLQALALGFFAFEL